MDAFTVAWFSKSLIPLYGKEVTCGGMCSYSSALRTKGSLTQCLLVFSLLANLGGVPWQVVVSPHHPHQCPRWQAWGFIAALCQVSTYNINTTRGAIAGSRIPLCIHVLYATLPLCLPQQCNSFNLTGFWPRLSEPINICHLEKCLVNNR